MNFTHYFYWSATTLLFLFTPILSAQPCGAINSQVSTDDVLFAVEAGSEGTNLALGYQTGPVVTFPLSDRVESTSPRTTKIYRTNAATTPESCIAVDRSGETYNTRYDVFRLTPNRSGRVTFSKDPGSQDSLQFTIFRDTFASDDGCGPNWVASSFTTAGGGINRLQLTIDMVLGTTYYLMVSPFTGGQINYPLPYTINVSDPSGGTPPTMYAGENFVVEDDFAANYDYIYLAADTEGEVIREVSKTGDFTGLPAGSYDVIGVNYDTLLVQEESFISETTTDIQTDGDGNPVCLQLSGNALSLSVVEAVAAPVEWLSLRGEIQATVVKLFWEVASETENDYFRIERSPDGKTWTDLGEVAGNGTTQVYAAFEFTDPHPRGGNTLYRLVQVDFDGTEHLSTVVEVDWKKPTGGKLITYPNPFSDQLTVELPEDAPLTIPRLFDLQGKEVTELIELRELGKRRAVIGTAGLARGMYLLRWGENELRIVKG
ncbi:hypothetical protein GGR28_002434 [Lewinella aquimaris]|uniref:Secretion system C-terminal sorting domain-containing protein n=1 Tax=Neolewinella aquimaris TaxID=1835722 RepID=A0A840E905_9BACT|nr:T9SS type A sorting domain-containing protein [Neolewinella aquimaris]MBB4079807.1 hypothetical protein [Neolewinella aquimaris]